MRPQREDEQRDTRGPGWLSDEKGRPYREEKGVRIYQRPEDRDAALDETYRVSPAVRVLMDCSGGPVRQVASLVCVHSAALAELFWREASQTAGNEPRTKYAQWCDKNFGRELEPSARGVLWGEVRAREVGATTRTLALFESYAEQQRFERAAAEMPKWLGTDGGDDEVLAENSLARVEEIVFRATGKRVSAANVPRPLSKRQWEKRKELLQKQARALRLDPEPDPMVETLK